MHASEGFLTARGGMTSTLRSLPGAWGKCCVSGLKELEINEEEGYAKLGGVTLRQGDWISLDGSTGHVYAEEIPTVPATISGHFETFMNWCDDVRRLEDSHQRGHSEGRETGARFRSRGHRTLPHRAHVL